MSNSKKEWLSPDAHPNAGTSVTLLCENVDNGKCITKKGTWNRTHWSLKSGPVPSSLRVIGWSE